MSRLVAVVGCVLLSVPARAEAPVSITLDQAIQLALTRNERAAIAGLNVTAAEAAVSRAHSPFLPTLSASGSDALRPRDTPINTAQGSITASQSLFAPTAFPLLAQAHHALESERAQSLEDRRQLAFDTARAYFSVLLGEAVVQAAQHKLETAKLDVADTDAQFKAQLVSSNDVTRAQISLASTVRELATDQGNLEADYVQLEFMVNARVTRGLAVPTALLTASEQPVPPADALIAGSISRRPDLIARKDQALAAHDFAREPRMRFLPTLALVGQMTATSNAGGSGHDVDGSIVLSAQWSLYDAGARSADERARDANASIADLSAAALARSVDAQVRAATAQLVGAQQAVVGARDAMTAARKSASETTILYRQGLAKAIELVDANDERFLAEVSYAEAEFSAATAYLALRQAMGDGPIESGAR